jgi:hypothetical protein
MSEHWLKQPWASAPGNSLRSCTTSARAVPDRGRAGGPAPKRSGWKRRVGVLAESPRGLGTPVLGQQPWIGDRRLLKATSPRIPNCRPVVLVNIAVLTKESYNLWPLYWSIHGGASRQAPTVASAVQRPRDYGGIPARMSRRSMTFPMEERLTRSIVDARTAPGNGVGAGGTETRSAASSSSDAGESTDLRLTSILLKPHPLHQTVKVLESVEVDDQATLPLLPAHENLHAGAEMFGEASLEVIELGSGSLLASGHRRRRGQGGRGNQTPNLRLKPPHRPLAVDHILSE